MSDDHVDYAGIFDPSLAQAEPETVEDLPDNDIVLVDEEPIDEPVEEVEDDPVVEPVEEAKASTNGEYFRALVDDGGKLRVRTEPDGDVLGHVTNKVLLHMIDDKNPDWALVEYDADSEIAQGYVKKSFIVEA